MMFKLPAVLTHLQAPTCLQQLQAHMTQALDAFILDASALTTFDSSALAVLFESLRMANQADKQLTIQHMPKDLMALATVYGVDALLPIER